MFFASDKIQMEESLLLLWASDEITEPVKIRTMAGIVQQVSPFSRQGINFVIAVLAESVGTKTSTRTALSNVWIPTQCTRRISHSTRSAGYVASSQRSGIIFSAVDYKENPAVKNFTSIAHLASGACRGDGHEMDTVRLVSQHVSLDETSHDDLTEQIEVWEREFREIRHRMLQGKWCL